MAALYVQHVRVGVGLDACNITAANFWRCVEECVQVSGLSLGIVPVVMYESGHGGEVWVVSPYEGSTCLCIQWDRANCLYGGFCPDL